MKDKNYLLTIEKKELGIEVSACFDKPEDVAKTAIALMLAAKENPFLDLFIKSAMAMSLLTGIDSDLDTTSEEDMPFSFPMKVNPKDKS